MARLDDTQISRELAALQGWQRDGDQITKTFEKRDFVQAMGFVNSIALLAEKANHHPDIDIRWNKITLTLATHSEGGLTDKDFSLARKIEQL